MKINDNPINSAFGIQIDVSKAHICAAVVAGAEALGFKWGVFGNDKVRPSSGFAVYSDTGYYLSGDIRPNFTKRTAESVDEFLGYIEKHGKPKPIEVVINDELTAIVRHDSTITVGCRSFKFDAVDRLSKAVSEMRSKQI